MTWDMITWEGAFTVLFGLAFLGIGLMFPLIGIQMWREHRETMDWCAEQKAELDRRAREREMRARGKATP